jgi:hypothetical protein
LVRYRHQQPSRKVETSCYSFLCPREDMFRNNLCRKWILCCISGQLCTLEGHHDHTRSRTKGGSFQVHTDSDLWIPRACCCFILLYAFSISPFSFSLILCLLSKWVLW